MSRPHEEDSDRCSALLSTWKGAYVCAVRSYVGVKTAEGSRLLYGRVLLEPGRSGIDETRFKCETEHVFAGRFVTAVGPHDRDAINAGARAGHIDGLDGTLSLTIEASRPFSNFFSPVYHPFVSDGPRLPSLLVRGGAKHALLTTAGEARQLDWELRSADVPFDTLDELLGHCGLPASAQFGDSTTAEIVARTPGVIGSGSAINRGEALIECRIARALDVGKLRLG
jgi:hypothetical protein